MTFIKSNTSKGGISLMALCSTKPWECGCTDTNGPSYQANSHQFKRVSNQKQEKNSN